MSEPRNPFRFEAPGKGKATRERAMVLEEEAEGAMHACDWTSARALFAESAAIYTSLKLPSDAARVGLQGGICLIEVGNFADAVDSAEITLDAARASRDNDLLNRALYHAGKVNLELNRNGAASRRLDELLENLDRSPSPEMRACALYLLAASLLAQDMPEKFEETWDRAQRSSQKTSPTIELAEAMATCAEKLTESIAPGRLFAMLEEALRVYRGAGYLPGICGSLLRALPSVHICAIPGASWEFAFCLRRLFWCSRRPGREAASLLALGKLLCCVGRPAEAMSLLKESVARAGAQDSAVKVEALVELGCVAFLEDHLDLARSLYTRGFDEILTLDAAMRPHQACLLAERILEVEDLPAASLYSAKAAVVARSAGDINSYAQALILRATAASRQGDLDTCARQLDEAMGHFAHFGPEASLGRTLRLRAVCASQEPNGTPPADHLARARRFAISGKDSVGLIMALTTAASTRTAASNSDQILAHLNQALELTYTASCAHDFQLARATGAASYLAEILVDRDEDRQAMHVCLQELMIPPVAGGLIAYAHALEQTARIASRRGLRREAARLCSGASALRTRTGSPPSWVGAFEPEPGDRATWFELCGTAFTVADSF